jgi:hypothetical protein
MADAPAYRPGIEGPKKCPGKPSALPREHTRHALHAAWAKLSVDIGLRDSGPGIRSGFQHRPPRSC